jgi:hypothetical protein
MAARDGITIGDTVLVEDHAVGALETEAGVEGAATVGDGALSVRDRTRTGVDREREAAPRVLAGVVIAVAVVDVPDHEAVLVGEALHPVRLGRAPAEVVRASFRVAS